MTALEQQLVAALRAFADEAQREGAFPHEVAEARKAISRAEAEHDSEAPFAAAYGDLGIDPEDVFNDQPDPRDAEAFLPDEED